MQTNQFSSRHNGLGESDIQDMLKSLNVNSLQELIKQVIPHDIQLDTELELPDAMTESEYLEHINALGNQNESFRSFIGMGYYSSHTPMVLVRNILEKLESRVE
jgi:glycine dehydrogenase